MNFIHGKFLRRGPEGPVYGNVRYEPSLWNATDRFVQGLPTTNNQVEGFNNRLQCVIACDHPSVYTLITKLKQEQARTERCIVRGIAGERFPQSRQNQLRKRRLENIWASRQFKTTIDYLQAVAMNFVSAY